MCVYTYIHTYMYVCIYIPSIYTFVFFLDLEPETVFQLTQGMSVRPRLLMLLSYPLSRSVPAA